MDRNIAKRYGERGVKLYGIQDSAVGLMNMLLVAHNKGLGSVWIGGFSEEEVINILNLPPNLRPVAIVPIGYPAFTPSPPKRMVTEEFITFIK
jgi:nitroreductase